MKKYYGFIILFLFYELSYGQIIIKDDFLVSQSLNQEIYFPSLAVSPDGRFGFSWGDTRNGINGTGDGTGRIYSQLYNANGTPQTNGNSYTDNISYGASYDNFSLTRSTCEFLPNGTFVIAWHVGGYTGINSPVHDVYYSAFSAAATKIVNGVQLNVTGVGAYPYGKRPQIVVVPPSQFAVVYEYDNSQGYEIGATTVDGTTGSLIGYTNIISDTKTSVRVYPSAASNGANTVSVWTDARLDNYGDIFMQRFANGAPAGGNTKVNDNATTNTYNQWAKVAMGTDGKFVVIWLDTRSSAGGDVYAQHFDANGTKIGVNVKLTNSNSSLYPLMPSIAMYNNDNYVITWTDSIPNQRYTCKTRFFNFGGTPLTPVLSVSNNVNSSESYNSDVKVNKDGLTFYTWDDRRNSFKGNVYGKVLSGFGTNTSVINFKNDLKFSVYPNPVSENLQVDFNDQSINHVKIMLTDLLGNKIFETWKSVINANVSVEMGNISKGMYLLRIETNTSSNTVKLLKE